MEIDVEPGDEREISGAMLGKWRAGMLIGCLRGARSDGSGARRVACQLFDVLRCMRRCSVDGSE